MHSQALADAMKLQRPSLYRYAVNITCNRDDAEDAVQDACVRGWIARGQFRGDCAPLTWLCTIVRCAILDAWKSRRGRETVCIDDTRDAAMESDLLAGVEAERVAAALSALTQAHRDVMTAYLDGAGYMEIAVAQGLPLGTVQSRLNRARRALRRILDADTA